MALEPGTTVGPYEIVGLIGAGGMGEVYRARDPRLQRTVAIKVLPPSFSTDPDRLRRFEYEARAAGSLSHPNIVGVYDVGLHDASPYIVTEFLEGQTLRDRLVSQLSVERAIDYAAQMAKGLAAAHAKGILHRDLKPENVFVAKDGCAKILDFGLAKSTAPVAADGATMTSLPEDLSTPGTVLGTAGYMSPEQVLGKPLDARSDIFSFGAVLYEMLAGRRAFRRQSAIETMHAIVHEELPDTSDLTPRVPASLLSILRRCLAREADQRFQSASDLAFALSALTQRTSEVGVLPGVAPFRTKRRTLAMAVIGGAILATALVAAGYYLGRSTRTVTPPSLRQLTFRRGAIKAARFAPDGQTVVFDAAWDGKPSQMFSMRVDTAESLPLPLPEGRVLSVSTAGELAILTKTRSFYEPGTLARVPLGGSGSREILDHVVDADWSPDGTTLAVIRQEGRTRQWLEFPIGNVVYMPATPTLFSLRVSPDGELVALVEQVVGGGGSGWVAVVDRHGAIKRLSQKWAAIADSLAWTPSGAEVWFNASEVGTNFAVHAVRRDGRERIVEQSTGSVRIQDIARDGRALLVHDLFRAGMSGLAPGQTLERDLSWLDLSRPVDLSADGRTVLFAESGSGAGSIPGVFVRPTDGSAAVRLGAGAPLALSPDGTSVLADSVEAKPGLILLRTGTGQPKVLDIGNLVQPGAASWAQDSKRIFFTANEPGRPRRTFVQNVDAGHPKPITPEGIRGRLVSPDEKEIITTDPQQGVLRYPLQGGPSVPLKGLQDGDVLLRWSGDGRSIWAMNPTTVPPQIARIDASTGRRQVWREITFADPAGLDHGLFRIAITPDGGSYVYGYIRQLCDIYIADGLK